MRHDGDTRLDGKRIAVTGTSRGLGRALVEAFVGAGAMVIAHARRGAEAVRASSARPARSTATSAIRVCPPASRPRPTRWAASTRWS